jgi:hypothetical protein
VVPFRVAVRVSVFSRESASFFAIWMVLQPGIGAGIGWLMRERPLRFDFRLFGAGLLCILLGGVIVEELRAWLLVREVGPEIFTDAPADAGKYFHFQLWHNLDFIGQMLTTFSYGMEVAILPFLVGVVALAVVLGLSNPRRCLALGLTHLALVASLLLFGVFQETRIYLELMRWA